MGIETVNVNGERYQIAQASAVKQKSLLALLSKRLMWNLGQDTEVKLDVNFLVGALMGMPENEFDQVAEIVLYKTAKEGTPELVSVDDFHGQIFNYYLLTAEAVRVNIADFLSWLDVARDPANSQKPAGNSVT